MGPWEWSENEAVLHWDERVSSRAQMVADIQLMPVRRRAYSGDRPAQL